MKINENYRKLPVSYFFQNINSKVEAFVNEHPDANIIKLGIGDVTRPLVPGVLEALHKAVDEQAKTETFYGYGPEGGYPFLREAIAKHDFNAYGMPIKPDEIFVSDGAKSDSANIQELFAQDIKVAVGDPVYPVYVDSNALAGRLGELDKETHHWNNLTYLTMDENNDYSLPLPEKKVDLIYLCYPNNPTGITLSKDQLQKWVDYAIANKSIIIFDAAYEAYITENEIPHSIYQCEGAEKCAIEMRSFSKRAGFTGLRLGYTVVPKAIEFDGQSLNQMWSRRQTTKFNGAPYIVQRAGEATYHEPVASQIQENIDYYMENARIIREGLESVGFTVFGGVNAPYIWLRIPNNNDSWSFFEEVLVNTQIVGTPGIGFGPGGEGYFRLTAFNTRELTTEAINRLKTYFAS